MAAVYLYNVNRRIQRAERIFRDRKSLEDLRDNDILSNYRLDRRSIEDLVRLVRPSLERATSRVKAISVMSVKLLSIE